MSTGFDIESNDMLNSLQLQLFKIPSGEITNLPYLRQIGSFKKETILSTGMSTLEEIGTALDVLDNIPSVSTDIDGNILLRGNDAARVLINGKPSNLVGVNSSFIKQLPTDAIEKVEVITSPSARFEAQGTGGIINLILRKSKKLGLNGSLSLNYAEPKSNGVSANSNYRSGKLNFFNSLGINDRNRPGESGGFTEYFNGDEPSTFFLEDRDRNRNNKGYLINNGVEWFIDENTSSIVLPSGK